MLDSYLGVEEGLPEPSPTGIRMGLILAMLNHASFKPTARHPELFAIVRDHTEAFNDGYLLPFLLAGEDR
jgi:hypothetical protein